jgi:hypothetical protein
MQLKSAKTNGGWPFLIFKNKYSGVLNNIPIDILMKLNGMLSRGRAARIKKGDRTFMLEE